MTIKKHLIIGAGSAALGALEAIRQITSKDEVKLVSMDDCLPYSPAALPYLLSGKITEAELWMRDDSYFKGLASTLVKGKEVRQVIPDKQKVVYSDGSSEGYDTLLIASGSEPVKLAVENPEGVEIQEFRTLTDCRSLLRRLNGKKELAVSGGGMVGMETAAALLERGCRVDIIEKEPGVLTPYFDDEAEAYIRDIFTEHQARFFTGKEAVAIKSNGGRVRIDLSDGSHLEADILINATGARSRVSFLDGSGVKINEGILVDKRMGAGIDHIYAAGDVAEAQDFFTGSHHMNAIIPSAVRQGRVAGTNMAGGNAEYEGDIPMTAFNFLGNTAFSIGLPVAQDGAGQVLKQKDEQERRFKKLVFNGQKLVGGMFLNEKIDPGLILYLIKTRLDIAPHKEALFERTKPLSDPWLGSLKLQP